MFKIFSEGSFVEICILEDLYSLTMSEFGMSEVNEDLFPMATV